MSAGNGHVAVIGLGPGSARQVTPEASEAVAAAKWFYGYGPYVDRLELRPDQIKVASDNREEISRAQAALAKAAGGERVAVVSGGDPGVFAMAAINGPSLERAVVFQGRRNIRSRSECGASTPRP